MLYVSFELRTDDLIVMPSFMGSLALARLGCDCLIPLKLDLIWASFSSYIKTELRKNDRCACFSLSIELVHLNLSSNTSCDGIWSGVS